jgi:NAD(P)-dependent dehydrogenase (short-subunit alcohol dehydrogenase family)
MLPTKRTSTTLRNIRKCHPSRRGEKNLAELYVHQNPSTFSTKGACRPPVRIREAGYGRLLHISSTAGKEGAVNMPAYSASKAGILGLVKSLAREFALSGVTVNALAPGNVVPCFSLKCRKNSRLPRPPRSPWAGSGRPSKRPPSSDSSFHRLRF